MAKPAKPAKPAKLTPLQERFCRQYLIDLNGVAAYRRAGYVVKNAKVASVEACRLLANPSIRSRIKAMSEAQAKRLELKADDVLREAMRLAFSDPGDIYDFSGDEIRLKPANQIPEAARRAIKSIKIKDGVVTEIVYWDKPAAIDKLGKNLKLWDRTDEADDKDNEAIALAGEIESSIDARKRTEHDGGNEAGSAAP